MRFNKRVEDILVWLLGVLVFLFGLWLLDTIISSNLFWEVLKLLFEAAPYILVLGVLITFIKQAISAYKKDGIKSGLIAFFGPIGAIFLLTLGFRLFVINPIFVVVPLSTWLIYSLIKWIIQINRD